MWKDELGGQLSDVNAFVQQNVAFISEIRNYMKEKAELEREYAAKGEALARKYAARRNKKSAVLSVGAAVTGGTPKEWAAENDSTLLKAWARLLEEVESISNSHHTFAENIITAVSDQLKSVQAKKEEARKRHMAFYVKLVSEQERFAGDVAKARANYERICAQAEQTRQRQERAPDDRNRDKLRKQYAEESLEMKNAKNVYVLSVHIANAQQHKYYERDVPTIIDNLQILEKDRTQSVKELLAEYLNVYSEVIKSAQARVVTITDAIDRVDGSSDCELFERYNRNVDRVLPEPHRLTLADSSDEFDICTDADAAVFLANKLAKSKKRLQALEAQLADKKKEIDGLAALRDAYIRNPNMGDCGDVQENLTESLRHLTSLETMQTQYQTEIRVIVAAIDENDESTTQHQFKTASFTIPTTCDYCLGTIWGLSKQGHTCTVCGYNCHAKCEMKVPPNCSGVKGGAKASRNKAEREKEHAASHISTQSPKSSPASVSFQPSVSRDNSLQIGGSHAELPRAVALYDFDATEQDQLTMVAGDTVIVLEEDDGSGWIKVELEGSQGLVPASYVEMKATRDPNMSPVGTIPSSENSLAPNPCSAAPNKIHIVRVLYDFDGTNPSELTIREGEIIEVTHEDHESGWWEGLLNGQKGSFPSNYVTLVE